MPIEMPEGIVYEDRNVVSSEQDILRVKVAMYGTDDCVHLDLFDRLQNAARIFQNLAVNGYLPAPWENVRERIGQQSLRGFSQVSLVLIADRHYPLYGYVGGSASLIGTLEEFHSGRTVVSPGVNREVDHFRQFNYRPRTVQGDERVNHSLWRLGARSEYSRRLGSGKVDSQSSNAFGLAFDNFWPVGLHNKGYPPILRCAIYEIKPRFGIPVSPERSN
jgi:hypothetical protein